MNNLRTLVTPTKLLDTMDEKGHKVFEGPMNLNLIGIRHRGTDVNTFNDLFCVLYQNPGLNWRLHGFACTTDPGTYYRDNPLNVDGTAWVKTGQYPGLWRIGKHRNKYLALVQNRKITVNRYPGCTGIQGEQDIHPFGEEEGHFGINCHRAGHLKISTIVGRWSAGCQVLSGYGSFDHLMQLCTDSAQKYGPTFTYTLLSHNMLEQRGRYKGALNTQSQEVKVDKLADKWVSKFGYTREELARCSVCHVVHKIPQKVCASRCEACGSKYMKRLNAAMHSSEAYQAVGDRGWKGERIDWLKSQGGTDNE